MKVNKYTATLITFFLSACVHELVMWCLFKKLRGYLLFLQMDADSVGAAESQSFPEGTSDVGECDLLDWDLHRSESSVQSLPDHLMSLLHKARSDRSIEMYVTGERLVGWWDIPLLRCFYGETYETYRQNSIIMD